MTTPNDIITLALRDSGVLGVGQAPQSQDIADGLRRLNMMLAQWNRKRFLVFHLLDISCPCTGAQTYTVGPGGDFNTPRPDKLEAAYLRQTYIASPNNTDWPLKIIQSYEDYSRICVKYQGNIAYGVFYDAAFPTGILRPWPLPSNLYEIHLIVKAQLASFTELNQDYNLPPEYEPALHYGLCARLRPAYGMGPDSSITALANDALQTIRSANAASPTMKMPKGLYGRGAWYNYYGDIP